MAIVRDTQWLMLEACREFQRGACKRSDTECKYAHPAKSVVVENGRVTACFDSLKGRCTREDCKYLHPPPHLKTQLEINGKNSIAAQKMLQNFHNQQLQIQAAAAATMQLHQPGTTILPAHHPHALTNSMELVGCPSYPYDLGRYNSSCSRCIQTEAPSPGLSSSPALSTSPAVSESSFYSTYLYPMPVSMPMANQMPGQFYSPYMTAPAIAPTGQLQDFPTPGQFITQNGAVFPYLPQRPKNDKLELPTTPETFSKKRAREPADDIILNPTLPGLVPPSKKGVGAMSHHLAAQSVIQHHPAMYQQALATSMQVNGQPSHYLPQPKVSVNWHYQGAGGWVALPPQSWPKTATEVPMMPSVPPGATATMPSFYTHPVMAQQQSADTIPVCRDFKSGSCKRPNCRYAHVMEDYVEIIDGKVTLCRYAAQSRCTRPKCKFYHPPTSTALTVVTQVPMAALPAPVVTSV